MLEFEIYKGIFHLCGAAYAVPLFFDLVLDLENVRKG